MRRPFRQRADAARTMAIRGGSPSSRVHGRGARPREGIAPINFQALRHTWASPPLWAASVMVVRRNLATSIPAKRGADDGDLAPSDVVEAICAHARSLGFMLTTVTVLRWTNGKCRIGVTRHSSARLLAAAVAVGISRRNPNTGPLGASR